MAITQAEMQNAFRAIRANKESADMDYACLAFMMARKHSTGVTIVEQVMFDIDMELRLDEIPAHLEVANG